jgi:hypothetical protein
MDDSLVNYGQLFNAGQAKTPDRKKEQNGVRVYNNEKSFDGYTLLCRSRGDHFYLIDMNGKVVHKWEIKNSSVHFGELTSKGHLLYSTTDRSIKTGRGVYELDWDGKLVWYYACPVDHDHTLLENGHTGLYRHSGRCKPEFIEPFLEN